MKTIIKFNIFLFLLIGNIIFAQPHIKYDIGTRLYPFGRPQDVKEYDGEPLVDIGDFQVGSSPQGYGVIIIYNAGNEPFEILSADIDGDFSLNYDIDIWTVGWYDGFHGKHTPPITIIPSARYRFDVSFSPKALGTHTGTLKIYHNAPNSPSPMIIRVTGNGVNNGSPLLDGTNLIPFNESESIRTVEFPTIQVNRAEDIFLMYVGNSGNAPFNLSYTITGDEGLYFTSKDSLLPMLPNSITIQPSSFNLFDAYEVWFWPTDTGFHCCTLTVYHNVPNQPSPITKVFTGRAIENSLNIDNTVEVNKPELDFGNVDIGSSLKKNITFTNLTIYDFTILSYEVYGGGVFTVLNELPIKIEGYWGDTKSGEYKSDDLIVEFAPNATRNYTGSIILTYQFNYMEKPARTNPIRLYGTGTNEIIFIEKPEDIPTVYNLSQNYPNPFNPTTKIEYSLPEASMVRLAIYNSLGQEVTNLVNEYKAAGKYSVDFNANNLPSGIYFYKIQAGNFNKTQKMVLMK